MSEDRPPPDSPTGRAEAEPVPVVFENLDLRDPHRVVEAMERGASANRDGPHRRGCCEVVRVGGGSSSPGSRLLLTGDLHDNPLHLLRLARAAGLVAGATAAAAHLTLHELIHGDRLTNGMDFSFRVLARAAALKAAFPDAVHTILANHELSQIVGAGVVKDGVRCVDAFNDAIEHAFPHDAARVHAAVAGFIRSMPLAVRFVCDGMPDILCAHSLPAPELMDRFDPGVLDRDLTDDDLVPRRGSAHLMVWGRGQTPEQLAELAQRWNVGLFVLGHEKAESGVLVLEPNALILNSDHDRGVYLDLPVQTPRTPAAAAATARPLARA